MHDYDDYGEALDDGPGFFRSNNPHYSRRAHHFGPVDKDGLPVTKTKQSYPYSYGEYVVHRGGDYRTATNAVYSDRLYQWDSSKHEQACKDAFSQRSGSFSQQPFHEVQKYLSLYFGLDDLQLLLVCEGCNVSSGYPYWVFWYRSETEAKRQAEQRAQYAKEREERAAARQPKPQPHENRVPDEEEI